MSPELIPIAEFSLDEDGPNEFVALSDGQVFGWRYDRDSLWRADFSTGDSLSEGSLASPFRIIEWLPPGAAVERVVELASGLVVVCEVGGTMRLIDPAKRQGVALLAGHEAPVSDVRELRDGRIISCSSDATVRVWDRFTGTCEVVLQREGAVSINTDEQTRDAVYGTRELADGAILAWFGWAIADQVHGFVVWELPEAHARCEHLADHWQQDGDYAAIRRALRSSRIGEVLAVSDLGVVLSAFGGGELRWWNGATGEVVFRAEGLPGHVDGAVTVGTTWSVWSSTDSIHQWDIASGASALRVDQACSGALALNDGRLVTTSGKQGRVCVWASHDLALLTTFRGEEAIALANGTFFSWKRGYNEFGKGFVPGRAWLWPGVERPSTTTMSWDDYFEHLTDLKERHEAQEKAARKARDDEDDGAEDGEPLALDVTVTRWSEQDHEEYDDEGTYLYHRRCTASAELHAMGQLVAEAELIQHYDEGFEELYLSPPSSNESSESVYALIERAGETEATRLLRRCVTVPRWADSQTAKRAREGASYGLTVFCEGPKQCGEPMPAPGEACPKCGTTTKQRLFHEGCVALHARIMKRIQDSLSQDKQVRVLGDGHPRVHGRWSGEKPLAEVVARGLERGGAFAKGGIVRFIGPDDDGDVFLDRGADAPPCFLVVARAPKYSDSGATPSAWVLQLIVADVVPIDMLPRGTSEGIERCNDFNRRSALVRRYWDDRHVHLTAHLTVPSEPVDDASVEQTCAAFAWLLELVSREEKELVEEFEHFAKRDEYDDDAPPDSDDG